MKFSDEQLLDAYLVTLSYAKAAEILGDATRQAVDDRLRKMRAAGVDLPFTSRRPNGGTAYTPERVNQLNEYIHRKTQEINAREI